MHVIMLRIFDVEGFNQNVIIQYNGEKDWWHTQDFSNYLFHLNPALFLQDLPPSNQKSMNRTKSLLARPFLIIYFTQFYVTKWKMLRLPFYRGFKNHLFLFSFFFF